METEEKFALHPKTFRLEVKMIAEKMGFILLSSHSEESWKMRGEKKICVTP